MTISYTLEELTASDREIDFDRFGHAEAWRLGSWIAQTAQERGLAIGAGIWLGDQHVFQYGAAGTSADIDQWMRRKVALVRRYDTSSLLAATRIRSWGVTEPIANIGLDPWVHTLSGGAVPIRVHGSTVGVAVASGTTDAEEHALVVEGFRALIAG